MLHEIEVYIKQKILEYAEKSIPKGEKKKAVDKAVFEWIKEHLEEINLPGPDTVMRPVLIGLVKIILPVTTQVLYNTIKEQVEKLEPKE